MRLLLYAYLNYNYLQNSSALPPPNPKRNLPIGMHGAEPKTPHINIRPLLALFLNQFDVVRSQKNRGSEDDFLLGEMAAGAERVPAAVGDPGGGEAVQGEVGFFLNAVNLIIIIVAVFTGLIALQGDFIRLFVVVVVLLLHFFRLSQWSAAGIFRIDDEAIRPKDIEWVRISVPSGAPDFLVHRFRASGDA